MIVAGAGVDARRVQVELMIEESQHIKSSLKFVVVEFLNFLLFMPSIFCTINNTSPESYLSVVIVKAHE